MSGEIGHDEFERRIDTARERIETSNLEALIAYSSNRQYLPGNVLYFANFFGKEREQTIVVITKDSSLMLTDSAWDEYRARETCPLEVKVSSDLALGVANILTQSKVSRGSVGIAGWNYFPAPVFLALKKQLPDVSFAATKIVDEMRVVEKPD